LPSADQIFPKFSSPHIRLSTSGLRQPHWTSQWGKV
jgi:hypothetical protein